jgi:putative sterol carrier protein
MTDHTPQSGVSSDKTSAVTVEPSGSTRVDALFQKLNERAQEPSLGRSSGVYEFDIEGSGQWFLKLSNGAVQAVIRNKEARPDCVISCDTNDFIDIAEGRRNLVTAFLEGRVECAGDRALAVAFRGLLPVTL